jgi:enoyl-CoA hydratase/carnithine racemase
MTDGPSFTELRVEYRDAVVTLTLDRPTRRNALTRTLVAELEHALAIARDDEAVRAVVITGAGGAFSSGVDLDAATATTEPGPSFPEMLTSLTAAVHALEKPVLAAIEGPAYGAGLAIALAADLRVVAEDARLCEAYVRIGRFAGGGDTYWLPRVVGSGQALRMLWTGDVVTGADAHRIGLAEELVSPGNALAAALELAARIAQAPARVLGATKRAVYGMRDLPVEQALAWSVRLSEETSS